MSVVFKEVNDRKADDAEAELEFQKLLLRNQMMVQSDKKVATSQLMRRFQKDFAAKHLEKEILEQESKKGPQAEARERARQQYEADLEASREKIRAEKSRQLLRSETPELRQLLKKLEACYAGKVNHLRIMEKQNEAEQIRLLEAESRAAQVEVQKEERERDRLIAEEREREKYALRLAQQRQLIEKQKEKEAAYQAFLEEKHMTDLVLKEVCEEERQTELTRLLVQKTAQADIKNYLAAKSLWKDRNKKDVDEENRRIQEYWDSQKGRQTGLEMARQEKQAKQDEFLRAYSAKRNAEEREKLEKQTILDQLAVAEKSQLQEERDRQVSQEAMQKRLEMKFTLRQQAKARAMALVQEKEEEAAMRQMMMDEQARKDKLEEKSSELRRVKMAEHRASVERQIRERRVMKHIEMERALRSIEELRQEEANHDKLVEEERLTILREHAHELLGYLPHDILKPGDAEKLGDAYVDAVEKIRQAGNCYISAKSD